MGDFLDALERHKASDPGFAQAVDNITTDLRAPTNPHGIRADLVDSADAAIRAGKRAADVVDAHRVPVRPDLHDPVALPDEVDALRRTMSLLTFERWHLTPNEPSAQATWARRSTTPEAHRSYGRAQLRGATGRPNGVAWWTWREAGEALPSGEAYMAELALPESERTAAEADGVVVELAVRRADCRGAFFRPTGLEDFRADTPFRPNVGRAEAFGRTAPVFPAAPERARPEVVSRAAPYADAIEATATVEVVVRPLR